MKKNVKITSQNKVVTMSISTSMDKNQQFKNFVNISLTKHLTGLWGDTYPEDAELNNLAINDGSRVLSSYKCPKNLIGQKLGHYNSKITEDTSIWVITDAADDNGVRLATTVLFPPEY